MAAPAVLFLVVFWCHQLDVDVCQSTRDELLLWHPIVLEEVPQLLCEVQHQGDLH